MKSITTLGLGTKWVGCLLTKKRMFDRNAYLLLKAKAKHNPIIITGEKLINVDAYLEIMHRGKNRVFLFEDDKTSDDVFKAMIATGKQFGVLSKEINNKWRIKYFNQTANAKVCVAA